MIANLLLREINNVDKWQMCAFGCCDSYIFIEMPFLVGVSELRAPFTHSIDRCSHEHWTCKSTAKISILNLSGQNAEYFIFFAARHNSWYRWFNNKKKKKSIRLMLSLILLRCTTNAPRKLWSDSCDAFYFWFYQVAHTKSIKLDVTMRGVNINSQSRMRGPAKICENLFGVQRKSARADLENGRVHCTVRLKRNSDNRPAQFSCILTQIKRPFITPFEQRCSPVSAYIFFSLYLSRVSYKYCYTVCRWFQPQGNSWTVS